MSHLLAEFFKKKCDNCLQFKMELMLVCVLDGDSRSSMGRGMPDRGCVSCGSHPSACLLEKNKDGIVEADSDLAFMLAWLRDPSFP